MRRLLSSALVAAGLAAGCLAAACSSHPSPASLVIGTPTPEVKILLLPASAGTPATFRTQPRLPEHKATDGALAFKAQISGGAPWAEIGVANLTTLVGPPVTFSTAGSCDRLGGPAGTCLVTFTGLAASDIAVVGFDVRLYAAPGDPEPALVIDPVLIIKGG